MGRPLRIQVPGGICHITARGNRGQLISLDDYDCRRLLVFFADTVERFDWRCIAYCLMPNHYHLVFETPEANISAGMHRLNTVYAKRFNARHGLDGHLFQGRFDSRQIETDAHLIQAVRYVALNPVRAGLCREAIDWAWSSYPAAILLRASLLQLSLDRVLGNFAADPARALEALRAYVEAA